MTFEVLEAEKPPVSVPADFIEVRNVLRVVVPEHSSLSVTALFDPDRALSERIVTEQLTS